MDNTRPVRTNTADRAPNTSMTHMYVRTLVCTVCFEWNIHTNPVHPSESYLVSAVFFWIGTKIQKKSKKRNTQIEEEKIIIFDDQLLYHLIVLDEIYKKNAIAHYFVSLMQNSIVFVLIYTLDRKVLQEQLRYCSKSYLFRCFNFRGLRHCYVWSEVAI